MTYSLSLEKTCFRYVLHHQLHVNAGGIYVIFSRIILFVNT